MGVKIKGNYLYTRFTQEQRTNGPCCSSNIVFVIHDFLKEDDTLNYSQLHPFNMQLLTYLEQNSKTCPCLLY